MTEAELYAGVGEVFRAVFGRPVALRPELTARDVPGWDSFRQVELIVALEDRYGVTFRMAEINAMNDVGDLIRVLAGKAGGT